MNTARLWILLAAASLSGCDSTSKTTGPFLEQPEVLAACRQPGIDIKQPLEADEVFIESHALNLLAGSQDDRGHVLHPDLGAVVRYSLRKGFAALETDLGAELQSDGSVRPGRFARISVQPAHSPACKAFRHPWWEMPELRKLGVGPDQCVAVEPIEAPTAITRVLARPTRVFRIADGGLERFALWRVEVEAGTLDAQHRLQTGIRVTDHVARFVGSGKGYGGWAWGCPDRGARAQALDAAISGKGNPRLRRPEVVVVPAPEVAVAETALSAPAMAQLRWLERARCAGGANTYDAAGTVWIQDITVGNELRTALHVLRGDRLLVAPMPLPFPRGAYIHHSALHFQGGFAVNLTRGFRNDEWRRLVVFDEGLRHVATWTLTPEQMASLTPTDPATVNRCTDAQQDQFQRLPAASISPR